MADADAQGRRLALALAALDDVERERLLAKVPEEKRAFLQALITEVLPVIGGRMSAFEQVMAEFERSGSAFDEETLLRCLDGESIAVKRQIVAVLVGGQEERMTSHVRQLVADHVTARAAALPPVSSAGSAPRRWLRFPGRSR